MKPEKAHDLFSRRSNADLPDPFEASEYADVASDLGSAFRTQADRFEPSSDAYTNLANAVAKANRRTTYYTRPLAAAAVLVAVVGVGSYALSQSGSVSTTAAQPSTAALTATTSGPVGGEDGVPAGSQEYGDASGESAGGDTDVEMDTNDLPDPADQTVTTALKSVAEEEISVTINLDPVDFGGHRLLVGEDTHGLWPNETTPGAAAAAASPRQAAERFLQLIGEPYAHVGEIANDSAAIHTATEDDPSVRGPKVATVDLAALPDGRFVVIGASSEMVTGLTVTEGEGPLTKLTVAGRASGFEGVVDVRVVSAVDGSVLAETFTTAGAFELAPFTVDVPVNGAERAWVVVSSSGGASFMAEPFAAVEVAFDGIAAPTEYTVVRIPVDDVDDGLVLREAPGETSAALGVLNRGEQRVRRADDAPVYVDPSAWWKIETAGGSTGWVNSSYLAATTRIDSADKAHAANTVLELADALAKEQGEYAVRERLANIAISRRVPLRIGTFANNREVMAGEAVAAIETFVLNNLDMLTKGVASDAIHYANAETEFAAATYFGVAPVMAISTGTSPSGVYYVYLEQTVEGPQLIGLMAGPAN